MPLGISPGAKRLRIVQQSVRQFPAPVNLYPGRITEWILLRTGFRTRQSYVRQSLVMCDIQDLSLALA